MRMVGIMPCEYLEPTELLLWIQCAMSSEISAGEAWECVPFVPHRESGGAGEVGVCGEVSETCGLQYGACPTCDLG